MSDPFKVKVYSPGKAAGKVYEQCMQAVVAALKENKTSVEVQFVPCDELTAKDQRISELEALVNEAKEIVHSHKELSRLAGVSPAIESSWLSRKEKVMSHKTETPNTTSNTSSVVHSCHEACTVKECVESRNKPPEDQL